MDEEYLATLELYHLAVGQTIQWQLTWPDHPEFTVEHNWVEVTLTAPGGAQRVYRAGGWGREDLFEDVRGFILDHANVQGLKRGTHSTWRGAEWCKIPQ